MNNHMGAWIRGRMDACTRAATVRSAESRLLALHHATAGAGPSTINSCDVIDESISSSVKLDRTLTLLPRQRALL